MMTVRVRSARSLVWMVAGMALALILVWTTSSWRASASLQPDESTLVPVVPARILDTRDPVDLGLEGPLVSPVSQDLQVTGEVQTADGLRTVVPDGATGVVLNVTAVEPTAAGFVSVRPSGTPGAPTTSNLNFEAGVVAPNAVSVQLPTSGPSAGKVQITYDALGAAGPTTDVLVDVVAYTSSTGIADLAARVGALESALADANEAMVIIDESTDDADEAIATLENQVAGKQDACADGSVMAWGRTIATPGTDWVEFSDDSCTGVPLEIREVDPGLSPGLYQVRMEGYVLDPTSIQLTPSGDAAQVAGFLTNGTAEAITVLVQDSATTEDETGQFQVAVFSAAPADP